MMQIRTRGDACDRLRGKGAGGAWEISEKGAEEGGCIVQKEPLAPVQLWESLGQASGELQRKDCSLEEWPGSVSRTVLSHWLGATQGEYGLGVNAVADPKGVAEPEAAH